MDDRVHREADILPGEKGGDDDHGGEDYDDHQEGGDDDHEGEHYDDQHEGGCDHHEGAPFISYLFVSNSSLALLRSNSPRTTDRSSLVDSVEPSLWDLYFFFFSSECQSWHLSFFN